MASPPITVGELTDVPAPQSPVNAQFHQEVANRIVHRFTTVVQMNGWAAANGSIAYCAETGAHYARLSGGWWQLALQSNLASGETSLQNQINAVPQGALGVVHQSANLSGSGVTPVNIPGCSFTWNADPARWYRIAVDIGVITGDGRLFVKITDAAGGIVREAIVPTPSSGIGVHTEHVTSGLSGSITRKAMVNAGVAGISFFIDVGIHNTILTIEDLGAV